MKDFSSPKLEIKYILLKVVYIHLIYPFSSTYKPLGNGFNNISDRVTI
jgi:hypothetical protein